MATNNDDGGGGARSGGLVCAAVYLLCAPGECHACKRATRLFALMALPPFSLEGDHDEAMDNDGSMLKEVVELPPALRESIRTSTDNLYRPDFSRTARLTYWMNHCQHCQATQGDFFVQGPNGPFWPYDKAGEDAIQATRLEGPFRIPDAHTVYSGAMADWRNKRHGVVRPPPPAPKTRKPRAPKAR